MIIGLTGYAGVGKSYIASRLRTYHNFEVIPFARPLKQMLAALYAAGGLSPEEIAYRVAGPDKERADDLLMGATPRWAMQTLGTEWGRELIHEDLWTSIWAGAAQQTIRKGMSVVADDVRFDNEARTIRQLGGSVVQLHRDGVFHSSGHKSEDGVAYDFVLFNTTAERLLEELK